MTQNVTVLMGGWSAEREVSLISGAACAQSLKDAGYKVTTIDLQRDVAALMTQLSPRPDAVFNALHGRYGEDGCVQGLLDILAIPYTHSGLLASALAMDKPMTKRLCAHAGIPVAKHVIASQKEIAAGGVMAPPYVIKPTNEGSSVGIHIIYEADMDPLFEDSEWPFGHTVMVEEYIRGQELTVAVMGDRPLTVTEIATQREFYDYDAKYADGGSVHVVPAEISKSLADEAMTYALTAHNTLGCRGVSRTDFRFDGNQLFMLEINTQPGMTPTSLVPEQAVHVGMSFTELVLWMVENAECNS